MQVSSFIKTLALFSVGIVTCNNASSQTISASIGSKIDKQGKYLFYLHGAVVTELGNNAVNQSVPEWGPYEYLNILDSLAKRGFYVISEQRQKGVADSFYVIKISNQVDSLLQAGVKAKNIIVLGASAGWNITLHVSARLENGSLNYVVMGGCWPNTYKEYADIKLYGKFLSIIEKSDPHQTCEKIFDNQKEIKLFKEVTLNTGLSHGFIYKGYKEWINPIVEWIK